MLTHTFSKLVPKHKSRRNICGCLSFMTMWTRIFYNMTQINMYILCCASSELTIGLSKVDTYNIPCDLCWHVHSPTKLVPKHESQHNIHGCLSFAAKYIKYILQYDSNRHVHSTLWFDFISWPHVASPELTIHLSKVVMYNIPCDLC